MQELAMLVIHIFIIDFTMSWKILWLLASVRLVQPCPNNETQNFFHSKVLLYMLLYAKVLTVLSRVHTLLLKGQCICIVYPCEVI